MTLHQLSCLSSVIGAFCYLVGDILIVGFNLEPEKYSLLSKTYKEKIIHPILSYYMLKGTSKRLMWGAIFGMIGTPFLFGSLYMQHVLFINLPSFLYYSAISLSVISSSVSALAHASFFFVAELYKLIYKCDASSHEEILKTGNLFTKMLFTAWYPAVFCGLISNFILIISLFCKNSLLPQWAVLFNPIIVYFLFKISRPYFPKILKEYLAGAAFNVASIVGQTLISLLVWNHK